MALLVPPRTAPTYVAEAKAALGAGAYALEHSVPLWQNARTPQKMAEQAMAVYHQNAWVRDAEWIVSGNAASVEWHLEDDNGDEVTDKSRPELIAIRDLLEKPQGNLPLTQRQSGYSTRRAMTQVTLRHTGLCGTGFWYLDSTEALGGTPLAILYIRPDRMHAVEDKAGNLLGWTLDAPMGEDGAVPLRKEDVLPFYLDPPDRGHFGIGLVESTGLKLSLGPLADRHMAGVFGTGGRLAGMLIQRDAATTNDEQWDKFIRDYRNITSDPDAARRLQILRVPAEFVKTAATPAELDITKIAGLTRDDILALWGVPPSQAAIPVAAGLNSGETKAYDEAVLWQGAIHRRLQPYYETVQYGLLDRYKALGITVELVLDEPEFDDETPRYDLVNKSLSVRLTANERREIIGKEPLPDWDPETGEPLGVAIDLPINLTTVGAGPSEEKRPPRVVTVEAEPPPLLGAGKAATDRLQALRRQVDDIAVPDVKRAVAGVLARQKADVTGYLRRVGLEHVKRKPRDFGWDAGRSERALMDALRPHLGRIAGRVSVRVRSVLQPAKATADAFTDDVVTRVLTKGSGRVRNISETTRQALNDAISDALADAETIDEVIAAVEDLDVFGEYRAEMIARTESMFAYNAAALGSYADLGVRQVQAIDGDKDEECASRDGRTFSVDDAEGITDHPNGTLDWVPVLEVAA